MRPTRISNRLVWSLVALPFVAGATLAIGGLLESIDNEVASLYEKSKDALIRVHAQRVVSAGQFPAAPAHRIGTGFFIDSAGHALTTVSVLEGMTECWVEWRGRKLGAKILGQDAATNLALLQVDSPWSAKTTPAFPFLRAGDSAALRIGSMVIALGFPYNLPSAPSVGFVSGLDIQQGARLFVTDHIRAGCRLGPGQGGGPLLNTKGEVVGITVATHGDDQCYALPMNAAQRVSADLLEYGKTRYGWIGMSVGERRVEQPDTGLVETEVIIQQIYSNAPAATAGFLAQDVLTKIQTNRVQHVGDVLNSIFYCRSGDKVTFTVLRDGQQHRLSLVAGDPPPPQQAQTAPALTVVPAAGRR